MCVHAAGVTKCREIHSNLDRSKAYQRSARARGERAEETRTCRIMSRTITLRWPGATTRQFWLRFAVAPTPHPPLPVSNTNPHVVPNVPPSRGVERNERGRLATTTQNTEKKSAHMCIKQPKITSIKTSPIPNVTLLQWRLTTTGTARAICLKMGFC